MRTGHMAILLDGIYYVMNLVRASSSGSCLKAGFDRPSFPVHFKLYRSKYGWRRHACSALEGRIFICYPCLFPPLLTICSNPEGSCLPHSACMRH